MELKNRKFIKNTGKLPGFVDGTSDAFSWDAFNSFIEKNDTPTANAMYHGSNLRELAKLSPSGPNIPSSLPDIRTSEKDKLSYGTKQSDGSVASAGPWFAIGSWLGGGVAEGLQAQKSANQLLKEAGTSTGSIGGVKYTSYNPVNSLDIMSNYDKSTAIDFLTNPGRAITKIFTRGSQETEAEEALRRALRNKDYERNSALTTYLLAKDGKLPEYANGGWYNARVSSGETIIPLYGLPYVIPGKPNNNDSHKVHLEPGDMVAPNKDGISKYYQHTGDYYGTAAMIQAHQSGYKEGKLPGFKEGLFGNIVAHAIPALASIGQIYQAASLSPYTPQTYAANRYEDNALNTLRNLRINPYYILPSIYGVYGKNILAINRSGGLSAGLKMAGRTSAMNQTQQNVANMFTNSQNLNNSYLANWATSAINAGQADAQRRMAASQYDLDYFSRAHAARQQGIQMGIYNGINQLQSYIANDFKRRQFNDTMNLYRDQHKLDLNRFNWYMKNYNNGS